MPSLNRNALLSSFTMKLRNKPKILAALERFLRFPRIATPKVGTTRIPLQNGSRQSIVVEDKALSLELDLPRVVSDSIPQERPFRIGELCDDVVIEIFVQLEMRDVLALSQVCGSLRL